MTPTTRHRRAARAILEAEAEVARQRLAWAELAIALVERTAPGIAPIEPGALMTLFQLDRAAAWARLDQMSAGQRVLQAIEVACWLETVGVVVAWGDVLERWERRLVELSRDELAAA